MSKFSPTQIGQVVRIKPEWQDAGDADALFVVRTQDEPGKPRVDISSFDHIDMMLWPTFIARLDMLDFTDIVVEMEA